MTTVFVVYRGSLDARFDREYYVSKHLPIVREAWEPYGLEAVSALFPVGEGDTVAIAVCDFRDEGAVKDSFASPESGPVMADIARFTDLTPIQLLTVPLR